jgi:hypothetical protein
MVTDPDRTFFMLQRAALGRSKEASSFALGHSDASNISWIMFTAPRLSVEPEPKLRQCVAIAERCIPVDDASYLP